MDDIDRLVESGAGGEAERVWASRVRSTYVSGLLNRVLGDNDRLPRGIIASATDDTDIVVGLTRDGLIWTIDGWVEFDDDVEFEDIIELSQEEVAFTADALISGAVGLALSASMPVAFLDKRVSITSAATAPSGAKIIAVVDEMDRAAVLDLLAITAGPHVFRRNDGKWEADDEWLRAMKSVKPPIVVTIDGEMISAITAQIDEATRGKAFDKTSSLRGSASPGLEDREAEMWLEWALVASAKSKAYDYTGQMPAILQKYWLTGRGAAKVRWFTPGAFTRCQRQLRKYLPPQMVNGACANLGNKLGGRGVAYAVTGAS